MAPAEIVTFRMGKGTSFETVNQEERTFELGSITAKVSEDVGQTRVEISGEGLYCLVRGNDKLVKNAVNLDVGRMETFLKGRDSIEVRAKRSGDSIKVTNKPNL